ncbi:hypothetical protein CHARACLAT_002007 [Characodon lateralis]|uniref:Uncharacterized protein n=1 Tax=Characodon lateralis TaxID=208331 RepID=A0ABU7DFG0_9TELE|nr:hypothetical protein [Characodon lateralis]
MASFHPCHYRTIDQSASLAFAFREQADWPRPSKEWPGIQKLQAALSLPSKINQNNNRHIRQGGDTPIESGDEAIRVIILMEQYT